MKEYYVELYGKNAWGELFPIQDGYIRADDETDAHLLAIQKWWGDEFEELNPVSDIEEVEESS